jgi:hypothetical protein
MWFSNRKKNDLENDKMIFKKILLFFPDLILSILFMISFMCMILAMTKYERKETGWERL